MKINLQLGLTFSGYILFCSFLYLWGFWRHFEINILQFVDTSDIAKASIIPAIPAVAMFVVVSILNAYSTPTAADTKKYIDAGGAFKKYIIGVKIYYIVLSLSVWIPNTYIIFTGSSSEKIMSISWMLSSVLFVFLEMKTSIFQELSEKLRSFSILTICLLPTIFLVRGDSDGYNVVKGIDTYLVTANVGCSENKNEQFRYIATLSNKAFSISLDNGSLCIQDFEYLHLIKESKKNISSSKNDNTLISLVL